MHSPHISKSMSTATSTSTTTTVTVSGISHQPGSAAEQRRQQGSFVGLSTTLHTQESTRISSTYYQQDEPRLLSDVSVSDTSALQTDPLEAHTIYITITFGDDHQGRSACSSSLSIETSRSQKSSQPVDDFVPIVKKEPSPDPTDTNKWTIVDKSQERPYKCGYPGGCDKTYLKKHHLVRHFVKHTGRSKFKCPYPDCVGKKYFRDGAVLKRHIARRHTRDGLFQYLKDHMAHVHSPEAEKKLPKPQSISDSSFATTTTHSASISTMTPRVSQPELAAGQRQLGSYVGISTTIDTPESMQLAASYHQRDGLRLLAEVSTSQVNPFAALAAHQTVTFEDEAVTTGIAGVPNLPSDQNQAEHSPNPTDEWIIVDEFQERPYRCGYPGCDKTYLRKCHLTGHFLKHTGTSKFKCPYPDCAGDVYFRDSGALERHTTAKHTLDKPFQCKICERRFRRNDHLKSHKKKVHGIEEKNKSPKRKRK